MKRRLGIIAGAGMLLLAGCSRAYEVYQVGGVGGKFCVPKAHVVPRIPWIPASVPEGKDFAFSGCWRNDQAHQSDCPLPSSVQGGVVGPLFNFRKEVWKDLHADSYYKTVVTQPGSSLKVEDEGSVVTVSNKHDWRWYVWHKAAPLANGGEPGLESDDVLLATCQMNKVLLPGKNQKRNAIFCRRQVAGKNYALDYSFESKERIPHNVEALDAQIFAQVDRWRCKK